MENENTLDHLMKIEAQAAVLVDDAQAEAERRIHENEEKNRALFEERIKAETEKRETLLKKETEETRIQYQQTIEIYKKEISGVSVDEKHFISLLNEFLAAEG